MRFRLSQFYLHICFLAILGVIVIFAFSPNLLNQLSVRDLPVLQSFKTMFLGIILESIPFILLGIIVSSIMQIFISEAWIRKWTPQNQILGILYACGLGVLFPVCECGMIPVVRRLMAKGMPLYIGVVFMMVGPILNPVVYAATFTAFRTRPEMVYARMGLALFVGCCIGLIVYYFVTNNPLKSSISVSEKDHQHQDNHHNPQHQHTNGNKLYAVLEHACGEFFDMGKYLIIGSIVTAFIQAFIPRSDLLAIGQDGASSHLFMMGLAYVLSLCSTSDAFVAASFANTFSAGSLLTFLVFGPMIDFKSTLMLLAVFRARFVLLLAIWIILSVFVGANVIAQMFL
ncbi:permease [Paenibacillus guangzhouensis]|uniref:permease n=1 Tax=Paenibacillus guangzhouensis TaxID=1473112 RepID=UPI001D11D443|nr:permease [Paenibacillus guangzhouensis]